MKSPPMSRPDVGLARRSGSVHASLTDRPAERYAPNSGPRSRYLLVYNPPDDPGGGVDPGWTLVAWSDTTWHWAAPLAERGAATSAEPRVAQASAVRVLTEQGVVVEGWGGGGTLEAPAYWARVARRDVPVQRCDEPTVFPWLGRLRGHWSSSGSL